MFVFIKRTWSWKSVPRVLDSLLTTWLRAGTLPTEWKGEARRVPGRLAAPKRFRPCRPAHQALSPPEFYPGHTPLGGSLYNGPVSIRGVPPAGPGHRDAAEPLLRVPWAAGPRTAGLGAKWGITIKITESRTSDQETLTSRSPAGEPHGPPEGAGSGQAERGVQGSPGPPHISPPPPTPLQH